MDIRQLKHLVAMVELGTVHAAAEDQSISQPGLSGSIKRLEDQLGTKLFQREGRGMKPNRKGQAFYRHAKFMLEQLRLAKAEIGAGQSSLVIGVGEVRPSDFVAELSAGLLMEYPTLSLDFVQDNYENLYSTLENGDVDVAFVAAPPERLPDTLTGNLLTRSEMGVYCAPNHPLTLFKGEVQVFELEPYHWARNAGSPSTAPPVPHFEAQGASQLENPRVLNTATQEMAIQLVMHSNVLGYGPKMSFSLEILHGTVTHLDLPIAKRYSTFMEVRRRNVNSRVLDTAFKLAETYFEDRGN
jgi:DNA-binding transcriptional LysR family regulator